MMKIKQHSLLLLFSLLQLFVVAQRAGYHYEAKMDTIKTSGFYNVELTPAINAHLKTDCSDLRIINDSGKWVPHLLRNPNQEFSIETLFRNVKIIKKENTKTATEIIIESPDTSISNLLLEIKNTVAERYCTLTGSDDLKGWFIINDSIVIRPMMNENETNSSFGINFPAVNYKYLKIYITNRGKDPFNVISVAEHFVPYTALIDKGIVYRPAFENPPCSIIQFDSSDLSYIKVVQQAAYQFNRISLKISGAKYYSRTAGIYLPSSTQQSVSNPGQLISSFEISNNSTLEFHLPVIKSKEFCIIIHNKDNPALKAEDINTYIDYRVATAWLEKGTHYSLLMENEAADQPNYDLQKKNISPGQDFPIVRIAGIISLEQKTSISIPANNKKMIWLFIGIGVFVLGFFTWKLVADMNKTKA